MSCKTKRLSRISREQLTDMKRKFEQSSQQSQGEVMELELEKSLKAEFPADGIERIAKGKFGADILHKVMFSKWTALRHHRLGK